MVFDGRPMIGVSCCAAANCAFFAVSFSARRDLVQHRGREGGEDAPERARVDRDGGLEDQTFVFSSGDVHSMDEFCLPATKV